MGFEQQVAAFGTDQAIDPPDTQVAAGPVALVETTNDSMSVWTKSGARMWDQPTGIVDLNQFFLSNDPTYSLTDPSVLYDSGSQRWFMTGLAIDASLRSQLFAGISTSADPMGTWATYNVTPVAVSPAPGHLLDQPRLGINDDKVVMVYDDFQGCQNPSPPCTSLEDGVVVLSKSQMVGGLTLVGHTAFQALSSFGVRPVRSLTSTTTDYLIENQNLDNPPTNAVGIHAVTGDPNTPGSILVSPITSLALSRASALPPNAPQPSSAALVQTGDGRFDSAIWANNTLWAGMAAACVVPTGSCLRLIQVTTPVVTARPQQDAEIGQAPDYLYYPALMTDGSGNVVVVYTRSNTTTAPSVEATGQLQGSPNTQAAPVVIAAGSSVYDFGACSGANRWGDYSGAALDPSDPNILWVAGEYSASSDPCDWRTAIGQLSFTGPSTPQYSFSPYPISASGRLNPNTSRVVTLTVKGPANTAVYLAFTSSVPPPGQGTALVGATPLGSIPAKFFSDTNGHIVINYTTGPASTFDGSDVITASDSAANPTVTATDMYSQALCASSLAFAPGPIAPRGSLVGGQSVALSLTAKDDLNKPIAFGTVSLSLASFGGGSATVNGTPVTSNSVVSTNANGQVLITYSTPGTLPAAGGTDSFAASNLSNCVPTPNATDSYSYPPITPFYFAEGFTGTGFNEILSLFMPNQSGIIPIDIFTQSGQFRTYTVVTAGFVTVFDVNRAVGTNQQVSARVTLPGPGVVERTMHFNNGTWHGSTNIVGVNTPSKEWDFAEGSTLTIFAEYLSIQNPNPTTSATVTLNYATDAGVHPTRQFTIAANTRVTVAVYQGDRSASLSGPCDPLTTCGVGPGIVGVSVQVLSTQPIVAERPFYVMNYSFGSGPIRDGHDAFGANAPMTQWNFAEGTTLAGFNEYLTIQNPGLTLANVTLTYFYDSGVKTVHLGVNPQSRQTVIVNDTAHFGVGRGFVGVSTQVTSDQSIVAERPMYIYYDFGTGAVAGAHDVLGATVFNKVFWFATASTVSGENDYLSIQNPSASGANVSLNYYTDAGIFVVSIGVAPHSRYTVQVFSPTEGVGTNPPYYPIGIVVSSDQLVLVEKPTYGSNSATYGATDTMGYTPPAGF